MRKITTRVTAVETERLESMLKSARLSTGDRFRKRSARRMVWRRAIRNEEIDGREGKELTC